MSAPIFLKEESEIVYFPLKQNKTIKFNLKHPERNTHKNKTEKDNKIKLHIKEISVKTEYTLS